MKIARSVIYLGVSCTSEVAEKLMKIKAKKRSGPFSVREIGGFKQREGINDGSMILDLRRSINFDVNLESPLHVLYRRSQVWDPVESAFAEPLTATTRQGLKSVHCLNKLVFQRRASLPKTLNAERIC
jgi:hypothetical protein